jgi:DNA-binding LacI/PurR family transcriptional regulator
MEDVARAAGVHRTTVSRALRNDSHVIPAKRERIQQIARELGYCPNPLISALMTQRAERAAGSGVKAVIGYVLRTAANVTTSFALRKIEFSKQHAEERGYRLDAFVLRDDAGLRRIEDILKARGIRALCLGHASKPYERLRWQWENFTAVAMGRSLIVPRLHRVATDNYRDMINLLRHVRRHGYRKIGFCGHSNVLKGVEDLWPAALRAFQHRHPELRFSVLEAKGDMGREFGPWFRRVKPEVVISPSPVVERIMLREGIAVPQEAGFATLGCREEDPRLSGIVTSERALAAAGIDLLIAMLHRNERGIPVHPMTISIEGIWREGTTMRQVR